MGNVINLMASGRGGIKLSSLTIAAPPTKTQYVAGEYFSPSGMSVVAVYSNGMTETLAQNDYTYSPSGQLTGDDTAITITYVDAYGATASAVQTIICNRTPIAIPSQAGTLTYNQQTQSPVWSNYNTAYMTLSGTTSAINAGSYSAIFTLMNTDFYQWADGTLAAKNITWSIGQATGTMTASSYSLTINNDSPTATVTINKNTGGLISAVSNNTGIAIVSPSSSSSTSAVFTIYGVDNTAGATSVTFSLSADPNYTTPAPVTVDVSAEFTVISSILNENDWATICEVAASGQAANYWDIGDTKEVILNGQVGVYVFSNYSTNVYIIGINHNAAREGQNLIHFQFAKNSDGEDICFEDEYYSSTTDYECFKMHWSRSNSPGWENSVMRKIVCGDSKKARGALMIRALPEDLFSVVAPVTKYTVSRGDLETTTDYIFLLSEYEALGAITYSDSTEAQYQQEYAYYAAGNSTRKRSSNPLNGYRSWWLRSPVANENTDYCSIWRQDGTAYYEYANVSQGFAPCFCVGASTNGGV